MKLRLRRSRLALAAILVAAVLAPLEVCRAQTSVELAVTDEIGRPVPYAVLWVNGSTPSIADSTGKLRVLVRGDSARVVARRIGYREFNGSVRHAQGTARIQLLALAQLLDTVRISGVAVPSAALRGFYDRVERVRRGAIVGEFFSPEEVLAADAARVSDLLRRSRYVRVSRTQAGGRVNVPVLLGRGGCWMTVLVDGQHIRTVETGITGEAPGSIRGGGGGGAGGLVSVDDLVNGRAVSAVEIYPSTANAPAELQTLGGRGSCGIIAIWTGAP